MYWVTTNDAVELPRTGKQALRSSQAAKIMDGCPSQDSVMGGVSADGRSEHQVSSVMWTQIGG